ncbi:MAG: sel1 repeat family protein [Nitrospira sp.]|nr:sel1 repeat family protein [Nitrospira sp.]
MAKQGYPGLVVVPPSDRQLVKRRLTRWAFLAVTMVGAISALNIWLPPPDESGDCGQNHKPSFSADSYTPCVRTDQSSPYTDSSAVNPHISENANGGSKEAVSSSARKIVPSNVPLNRPATPSNTGGNSLLTLAGQEPKPAFRTITKHTTGQSERPAVARQTEKPENPPSHPVSPTTPALAVYASRDHQLAERGDAFAQYRLGRFYAQRDGHQTPESIGWYSKASTGLRRLAEAGNGEAMYVLGVMYAFGRGVTRDTEEARRWLIRAVEHRITAARPVLAGLEKHRVAGNARTDHGG